MTSASIEWIGGICVGDDKLQGLALFENSRDFLTLASNFLPWSLDVVCQLDSPATGVLDVLTEELLCHLAVVVVRNNVHLVLDDSTIVPCGTVH